MAVSDPVSATLRPVRRRRSSNRKPWFSGIVLVVFAIAGLFGPWLAPHDPDRVNLSSAMLPPWSDQASGFYLFGTDQLGRDVFSRLLDGAQVSFFVSLAVVALAGVMGVLIAVVGGLSGGRIDAVLTRTTDAALGFPVLLLAIIFAAIYGASVFIVIVVLALTSWAQYARVLRSEVIRIRTLDFVTMSRVMGGGPSWVIKRHLLPNIAPTFLVLATLQVGLAIIAEGSLSFVGIGVPPPAASWGNMLAESRQSLTEAWWLPVLPGICLSLTVLAANLMGDWLRTHLDPTTRR